MKKQPAKTNRPVIPKGGVRKDLRMKTIQIENIAEKPKLKKKKSTELTPLTLKDSTKLKKKHLRSILGDSAESIQHLLEVEDNDNATALIQKRLLQALIDLIPHAEDNVRKSKGQRGVYQINSLISSIRELLIDLQAAQDRGAIGASLNERVLRPAFLDVAMLLVREVDVLANEIKSLISVEDYKEVFRPLVLNSRTRIGEYIQKRYQDAATEVIQFMQR